MLKRNFNNFRYNINDNYLLIDVLRIYSTILVFFFHLKLVGFENGNFGIDIFFVISGFLITKLILQSEFDNNTKFFYQFVIKRINRIYPPLIITIFLTTIFGFFLVGDETLREISKSGIKSIYAISDYYYYYSGRNYFSLIDQERFLLHTWTLSVELKFYLIFGILFLFIRKKSFHFIMAIISLILIISIIISLFTSYYVENNRAVFFLTPLRFYQFLFGSMSFLIHLKINQIKLYKWTFSISSILLIVLSVFILIDFNRVILKNIAVAFITFLLLSFNCKIKINHSFKKFLKKTSFFTYYIYLVHYPIIKFLIYFEFKKNEILIYTFILTILFVYILNHLTKTLNFKIGK